MLAFVALVRLLIIVAVSPGAQARPGLALGNHSMLYLDTPPATIDRVFALTRQAGMRDPRMDFALLHVFAGGAEHPDVRRVDAVRMLVAKHGVNVLGTIYRDGAAAQARWMVRAARAFSRAGAAKVFVAGRDTGEFGGGSSFASEGFLTWPAANPKPAYWALKAALANPARAAPKAVESPALPKRRSGLDPGRADIP